MIRFLLTSCLLPVVLSAADSASGPLRPNDEGVVEAIFNPDENVASYGDWHSSKIGGGGYMLNVVMNPTNPDILYAHSDVGGIFRSDNSGRTWYMVHLNAFPQSLDCVRGLIVDPENPDIVVAAVGDQWTKKQGIFKSTDGGQNWEKTLDCQVYGNGPNRSLGRIFQRSPDDKNTIYVAPGPEGVFVSHDSGDTWESLGLEGHYVNDFKIDRTDPKRMFLCSEPRRMASKSSWRGSAKYFDLKGGLYRTEDGGNNWKLVQEKSPWEMVQSPVKPNRWYGLMHGTRVAYTDDGGETWEDASEGLDLTSEEKVGSSSDKSYKSIAAGPDFLVVGSGSGSFYIKKPLDEPWRKIEETREQGDWFARSKPGAWDHFGRATASVVIDESNPDHWFFTDWYSIYQTWDAGKTWTLCIDGIENTVIHTVMEMPGDPGIVHMGMADNGYFRSNDGAKSFKDGEGLPDNCKAIAVAPSDPQTVYILTPKYHGWYSDTLFVSLDGGQNFKRSPMTNIPTAKDKWRVNSLAVDANDSHRVYIGVSGPVEPGKGGVWMSEDRGGTWTWDSKGLPEGGGFFQSSIWDSGFQLARSVDGAMVATKSNAVYYREKDSEPWQRSSLSPQGSGSRFLQVIADPYGDGTFYLVEKFSGLHRSTDNGKTWEKIYDEGIEAFTIDSWGLRMAVALDEAGGIMASDDGGENWYALDGHVPQRHRLKLAFAGNRLVVGTPGNGVFYLPLTPEAKEDVRGESSPSKGKEFGKKSVGEIFIK